MTRTRKITPFIGMFVVDGKGVGLRFERDRNTLCRNPIKKWESAKPQRCASSWETRSQHTQRHLVQKSASWLQLRSVSKGRDAAQGVSEEDSQGDRSRIERNRLLLASEAGFDSALFLRWNTSSISTYSEPLLTAASVRKRTMSLISPHKSSRGRYKIQKVEEIGLRTRRWRSTRSMGRRRSTKLRI